MQLLCLIRVSKGEKIRNRYNLFFNTEKIIKAHSRNVSD